jgi:hypothetical protein
MEVKDFVVLDNYFDRQILIVSMILLRRRIIKIIYIASAENEDIDMAENNCIDNIFDYLYSFNVKLLFNLILYLCLLFLYLFVIVFDYLLLKFII